MMAKPKAVKPEAAILAKLSEICLSLPETERRDMNDHADFRVRGKVFATVRIHLNCTPGKTDGAAASKGLGASRQRGTLRV
jgi:hypothetical protein